MITLIEKLFTAKLTPKQKTILEFMGMGVVFVIANFIIWLCVTYGLWFELAMTMIGYGIYSMCRVLYQARLEYWTRREKYPDEYR
jgi:hypothetical protein